jgi:hypothetical protein
MIYIYGWQIEENGIPGEGAKFTISIPTSVFCFRQDYLVLKCSTEKQLKTSPSAQQYRRASFNLIFGTKAKRLKLLNPILFLDILFEAKDGLI